MYIEKLETRERLRRRLYEIEDKARKLRVAAHEAAKLVEEAEYEEKIERLWCEVFDQTQELEEDMVESMDRQEYGWFMDAYFGEREN